MKTIKLRSVLLSFLILGLSALIIISCQKDEAEEPTEDNIAQALENDEDALAMVRLMQMNSEDVLNALRKQNISVEEFRALYESADEARIAEALQLDPNVFFERSQRIVALAQKVNAKYPNLEQYVDDNQLHEDPFVTIGFLLDSGETLTGKGKCSGWRNWRNIAKYTVCVAACATSTVGWGYVLCTAVCYLSFCT